MTKKIEKQKHFQYFYFIMTLSEILGISTFDHDPSTNFSILKSVHRLVIIIIFIVSYFIYLPVLMESDLTKDVDPDLMRFEISARFFTSVIVLIVQLFKNYQIKEAFFKCLRFNFQHDDCLLSKYWKFPLISLTANISIFFINFFIFHFTYSIKILANVHYSVFVLLYVEYPCLQFAYLVAAIGHYINKMNDNMEQIFIKVKNKNLSKLDAVIIAKEINMNREKYLELIEITESVVKAFSHQIIICIADFVFEMTFFLQTSFTRFIFNSNEYSFWDTMIFFCNFSVVLALFLKITQETINCEKYLGKCMKINAIINHILNHSNDETIQYELSSFLKQNINRYVTFSLLGFFNLDNKLVYSIICALASYGIIIATYYISLKNSRELIFV